MGCNASTTGLAGNGSAQTLSALHVGRQAAEWEVVRVCLGAVNIGLKGASIAYISRADDGLERLSDPNVVEFVVWDGHRGLGHGPCPSATCSPCGAYA